MDPSESLQVLYTRYRYAIEGTQDGVWDWFPQTGRVVFSDEWKRMLGYEPAEIRDHVEEWSSRVHPEDLDGVFADIAAHVEGRLPFYRNEHRMRHKDGRWLWILDRGRVIERDADGRALRFVGTHQDITRERELSEALRRTEERFSEAEIVAGLGHWEYELASGKITWSKELFRLYGLEPGVEPDLASHLQTHIYDEDRERFYATVRASIEAGTPYEFEYRAVLPDGTPRWFYARGRPKLSPSGAVEGLRGTAQDIHERKLTELALADANERLRMLATRAEQASVAKSQFLATMSHEIRTPLNGVLGIAELLAATELTAEQRKYVELVHRSGAGLLTILNDVLDLSKIEAGHLELRMEACALPRLVGGVIELFEARALEKGLGLRFDWDGPSELEVLLDPARFRQVLVNLVANAIKFTEAGEVVVAVAQLPAGKDRLTARVSVSDTGIGIPDAAISRIFHPFQQVDTGSSRRFDGTGLGLSISARLVEAMGGRLSVTSKEGVGSTFTVEVPFPLVDPVAPRLDAIGGAPQAETVGAETAAPEVAEGCRVLVAEDNPVNRLVVEKLLRRLGCVVTVVEDGDAAARAVALERYDIVFMDCHMPVLDGLEATREIRARGSSVPIVALTANAFQEDEERCLAVGMNGYLAKPVSVSELRRALRTWASRE